MKEKKGGLAGIIAGNSAICQVGAEEESLLYYGYPIEQLASSSSFEEVAYLLLRGELPTKEELTDYKKQLMTLRDLPQPLKEMLERIPKNSEMMHVLRTGCSALGHFEPEKDPRQNIAIADRLISCLSSMLLYWLKFSETGKRISLDSGEDSLSGHILHLLSGKIPNELQRRCLDCSLILYAEHEFNASTFTVRTIASTLSDFYSAICGGIGALLGPLHGGANEKAWELIQQFENEEEAEKEIKRRLEHKELIMGFGHRVYTTKDPRTPIVKRWAEQLTRNAREEQLFKNAERIEQVMWDEKRLFPNLDFYSSLAFAFCDIPPGLFTPLFVFSRITGWSAHLLEQRRDNKLIRPISNYKGPNIRSWIPIEKREKISHPSTQ